MIDPFTPNLIEGDHIHNTHSLSEPICVYYNVFTNDTAEWYTQTGTTHFTTTTVPAPLTRRVVIWVLNKKQCVHSSVFMSR